MCLARMVLEMHLEKGLIALVRVVKRADL